MLGDQEEQCNQWSKLFLLNMCLVALEAFTLWTGIFPSGSLFLYKKWCKFASPKHHQLCDF